MTRQGSGLLSKWPRQRILLTLRHYIRRVKRLREQDQIRSLATVLLILRRLLTRNYTNGFPRAKHVSHIRLQGDHNNNKMERLNGTIRDREKTMRRLKKANTLYSMVCKSIIITFVSIKAWRERHLARNAESR
jgi:hypothetical protein